MISVRRLRRSKREAEASTSVGRSGTVIREGRSAALLDGGGRCGSVDGGGRGLCGRPKPGFGGRPACAEQSDPGFVSPTGSLQGWKRTNPIAGLLQSSRRTWSATAVSWKSDEAGTLARLKTVRLELIDPAIARCKGRIIKTTGDGMLVEFQSVTEALRCAVDFQERMSRRNRDMPASRSLLYRIGVNLGDVIIDEDDIFGDGVNVAARLEFDRRARRHLHFGGGARSGRRPARGWLTRISATGKSRTSAGRSASSKS